MTDKRLLIKGRGVDLVGIAPCHFEKVVGWRNDPDNRRCFFSHLELTVEGQKEWYARYLEDESDLTFIIIMKPGTPVGMAALYNLDHENKTAEFGRLLIGEGRYRRAGIASEAVELCINYARAVMGLRRLHLEVYEWNMPAVSFYKKLGFTMKPSKAPLPAGCGTGKILRLVLDLCRSAAGGTG